MIGALSVVSGGGRTLAQSSGEAAPDPAQSPNQVWLEPTPIAVVELFTSEGCSSCPPADKLLGELASEFEGRVIALAFHVDIWDRLGWEDPFATAEGTRRHRQMSRLLLDTRQVATPAMAIHATTMFAGVDEDKARAAITTALEKPPVAQVRIEAKPVAAAGAESDDKPSASAIELRAVIEVPTRDRLPLRTSVVIALTEDGLSSDVTAGENKGQTLAHERVVRWFTIQRPDWEPEAAPAPDKDGDAKELKPQPVARAVTKVQVPLASIAPAANLKNARLVAIAFDEANWCVLGATEQRIESGEARPK